MEVELRDHRSLRRREWFKWAYETYDVMRKLLANLPGSPGQKALRFIIDSIDPHSVVLIAVDVGKLEEYIEALKLPRLPDGVIRELQRVHDERARFNPELRV